MGAATFRLDSDRSPRSVIDDGNSWRRHPWFVAPDRVIVAGDPAKVVKTIGAKT
jgi:hypothetical protein